MPTNARRVILAIAFTAPLIATTPASADIMDRLDAASAVERKLDRRDNSYDYYAFCDQLGRKRFSCEWSGYGRDGDDVSGRATARKLGFYDRFKVKITSWHQW